MDYAKLDPRLAARYRAYLLVMEEETPAGLPADRCLAVAVVFEGPSAPLGRLCCKDYFQARKYFECIFAKRLLRTARRQTSPALEHRFPPAF
jgi:hypothetical protein